MPFSDFKRMDMKVKTMDRPGPPTTFKTVKIVIHGGELFETTVNKLLMKIWKTDGYHSVLALTHFD